MTDPESSQTESDKIQTGDIRDSKGIAIGRYARAVVFEGDLVIYVMEKQVVAIPPLAAIAIAMVTLGVAFLVAAKVADFRAASVPTIMTGDFNVAVAEFQVAGQGEGLDDAQELAQSIANAIDREMQGLATELGQTIEVRPPQKTGTIKGRTEKERAEAAHALAEGINADVVVYGVVEVDGLAARIKPEFYVSGGEFSPAAEATGQYRMGSLISIDKVDNRTRKREVGDVFADRSRALAFVIYGLADLFIGQYTAAEANFSEALKIRAWDNLDVIYQLLGNAALGQRDLTKAETYFWRALDTNPSYSRAYAGLGAVFFQQALGDLESDTFETINDDLLGQSMEKYQQAIDPGLDHSPLADTPAKANFGLGGAYLIRALVHAEKGDNGMSDPSLLLAIQAYGNVIQAYGDGDSPRIKELAGYAHAHRGLIYRLTGQLEQAIPEYEQALRLLPPLERTREIEASYEAALADICANLGQPFRTTELRKPAGNAPNDFDWTVSESARDSELKSSADLIIDSDTVVAVNVKYELSIGQRLWLPLILKN